MWGEMKRIWLIKFVLIIFITVAIFNYRGDSLSEWAVKTGMFLRGFSTSSVDTRNIATKINTDELQSDKKVRKERLKEESAQKFSSSDDSILGAFIANVLNKVLDTPNGQMLLKESIGRAASRNQFSQGQNIAERKYLSIDSVIGKGREVECGDEIEISYNIYKQSDRSVKDKNKLKTKIVVGQNNLPKPLEGGLIGMKEGGKRKVLYFVEDILTAHKEQGDKPNYKQMISEVLLDKVRSPQMDNRSNIRVFVHNPSRIGKRVLCGEDVNFVYKVSDIHNNLLSGKGDANRIALNVYHDSKSPLRAIYNNLVDVYADHVRLSAIMRFDQVKQLIPGFKRKKNNNVADDSLVILDLYGVPRASIQEIQMDAFFDKMMGLKYQK